MSTATQKGKKGFLPGRSGNPGGRPKKDVEFVEACKAHTKDALAFLIALMNNDQADNSDRIKAANIIIERAYGKPMQAVDIGSSDGTPLVAVIKNA